MKKLILLGAVASLLYGTTVSAQSSFATTNSLIPPQFLGFNGTGPGGAKTLQIRNNYNLPIEMYTNGIQRMHINQNTGLTDGFIGMGNGFNNPQSLLHLNNPTNQETWMQITHNQTGQTNTDGLRLGIINTTGGAQPSVAFLRWHENSPFIVQTGGSTINGSTINGGERIRISAIGAPTDNPDPFNVQGNETRIGISHNSLSIGTASTPITRIRSLLHLGYNIGEMAGNIALNDGWRSWMDVGTFTSVGREHMYFGFKQEITGGVIGVLPEDSHYEAIINWGDNEIAGVGERNTNLRFIYTTPQIGTVNTPQSQVDGLETMRIEPTVATTLAAPNFGMVGIGNFSSTGPNTATPDIVDAKLDIDGDLRVRTITQDNTLTRVLVVDPNDHNRVHWRDGSNLGGNVTADNGLSVSPANNIQLGNDVGLTTAQLLNDREIPMNGNNIMFNDAANSSSALTIGHPLGTANPILGKFEVINDSYRIGGLVSSVGNDPISQIGFFSQALHTGASGNATAINANCLGATGLGIGIGVNSISRGTTSEFNIAFNGDAANGNFHTIVANLDVDGSSSPRNYGIQVEVINGTNSSSTNFGAQLIVTTPGSINYGIMSTVSGATTNWAGFFNGNVFVSGSVGPSDANLKTNVESLDNAMDVINQLNPVSFDFDNSIKPRLNLQQGKQYGLIAQEVETILPEMVGSTTLPAEYDSLGNEIDASFDFKTLDYEKFVPILIAGMKEQQNNLNTKDSLINNLESRLTYLESCIRNANICEGGQ